MDNLNDLLLQLKGKSNEEIIDILNCEYGVNCPPHSEPERASCKKWFAKVFTYCRNDQLQDLITDFLNDINTNKEFKDFCFQEEDTVFLGCICPCGRKQTILYYTLTREQD